MRAPKCRSRKHTSYNGCGDPRCPEGLHVETLLNEAVKSGKFDDYLAVKQKQDLKISVQGLGGFDQDGWAQVFIQNPSNNQEGRYLRVSPNRKKLRESLAKIDLTQIKDFDSARDIEQYVRETFLGAVQYHLRESKANPKYGEDWNALSVSQITIDADVRGLGIAKHLRKTLIKYADKTDSIISGTPTNKGNGQTIEGEPGHTEAALKHREWLVNSYYAAGYVDNPCWSNFGNDGADWLTKEYYVDDVIAHSHFTDKARRFLYERGQYIRFPNGKMPKGMLKHGSKFDISTYRYPKQVKTKEDVHEAINAMYKQLRS